MATTTSDKEENANDYDEQGLIFVDGEDTCDGNECELNVRL